MTICTIHLCEMKNKFIYKGTIILGFLIVLLNDKLLSLIGCFTVVLIQFLVSNLEKTETDCVVEEFISIYNL
jgi:hypothetical protein